MHYLRHSGDINNVTLKYREDSLPCNQHMKEITFGTRGTFRLTVSLPGFAQCLLSMRPAEDLSAGNPFALIPRLQRFARI